MFANNRTNPMKPWRRLTGLRRLWRRQEGAAALEFSLVVMPFFLLMFIIMETALVFFAEQLMQTAAADSSRLIMTGQGHSFDETAFKNAVCNRLYVLPNCSGELKLTVKTYAKGATIPNASTVELGSDGRPKSSYTSSNPNEIVVVRLIYDWPISTSLIQKYLVNTKDPSDPTKAGNTRRLIATLAFKNEPYVN